MSDTRAKCRHCGGPIGDPDGITGVGDWSHGSTAGCNAYMKGRIAELEARILALETVTDEDVERAAKEVCREICAYVGDPPCWSVDGPWPNPQCDTPGCHASARAALSIRRGE